MKYLVVLLDPRDSGRIIVRRTIEASTRYGAVVDFVADLKTSWDKPRMTSATLYPYIRVRELEGSRMLGAELGLRA